MNHIKNRVCSIFIVFATFGSVQVAVSETIPIKVIDAVGNASLAIEVKKSEKGMEYMMSGQYGRCSFVCDENFGQAFVAGKNKFVWFIPTQKMGHQIAAYVSLDENIVYIMNFEKILKDHKFIPFVYTRSGSDEVWEYWNIGEWDFSNLGVGVLCRLSPNESINGMIYYNHVDRAVKVIDLKAKVEKPETSYSLNNAEILVSKIPLVRRDKKK